MYRSLQQLSKWEHAILDNITEISERKINQNRSCMVNVDIGLFVIMYTGQDAEAQIMQTNTKQKLKQM